VTILDSILEDKRKEVAEARKAIGLERIMLMARDAEPPRPFKESLRQVPFGLIAEIKRASPSKGTLLGDFDHRKLAQEYELGGATAISVLTDKKHFKGEASYLKDVKELIHIPVLRKDFIIDEYQVFESRAIGADAILLIVRALAPEVLKRLHDLAISLGMAVLVETHTQEEIAVANSIGANIIGINNRNLASFEVSIATSISLFPFIRKGAAAVSESGISSRGDMLTLQSAGFRAALVGEGLVTRTDRVAAVRELVRR
jgi:indole-3-glycerol phosphate synthase